MACRGAWRPGRVAQRARGLRERAAQRFARAAPPALPGNDAVEHARKADEMEAKSIVVVTPPAATPVTLPAPTGA
jgi:hypothetical protein